MSNYEPEKCQAEFDRLSSERDYLAQALKSTSDHLQKMQVTNSSLTQEVDRLKAEFNLMMFAKDKAVNECNIQKAKAERLAVYLRNIRNELGEVQPGYPAPIANAVDIAKEVLTEFEKKP